MTDEQKAALRAQLQRTISRDELLIEVEHMREILGLPDDGKSTVDLYELRKVRALERITNILESWDSNGRVEIMGGVTAYKEE